MPKFNYIAVGPDGAQVKGTEEADTFAALGRLLHDRDLTVKEAREKKSIMQFEITRKKVPRKDLMHFSRQLSAFLKASVPILDAIEVIREEMTNKLFKAALDDIAENVKAGASLRRRRQGPPRGLPARLPRHAGVRRDDRQPGRGPRPALRLHRPRPRGPQRKITSALMYPAIVAPDVGRRPSCVLAVFVLPRFGTSSHRSTPRCRCRPGCCSAVSGFVSDHWWIVPGPGLLAFAGLGSGRLRTAEGQESPGSDDPVDPGARRPRAPRHPRAVLPGARARWSAPASPSPTPWP